MDVNRLFFTILFFLFAFGLSMKTIAQSTQQQTKTHQASFFLEGKISLDSLTKLIHHNSGLRFSFNSAKVKGSKEIFFLKGKYPLSAILQQIRKTTSLYYSFYNGYVVFQDNPPKQKKKNPSTNNKQLGETPYKTLIKTAWKTNKNKEKKYVVVKNEPQKNFPQKQPIDIQTNGADRLFEDTAKSKKTVQKGNQATEIIIVIDSSKNTVTKKGQPSLQKSSTNTLTDSVRVVSLDKKKDNPKPTKAFQKTSLKNNGAQNFHYGLQWNLNILSYGFAQYFTGTNGNNQFYNFLIPGLWASKQIGKTNNELLLLLKPSQQYITANGIVASSIDSLSPRDSSRVQKNSSLIKTNSWYVGLQYNYQINDKWVIGGGLNLNWQTAGLITVRTTRVSNGALVSDSLYEIKKSSAGWQYVKSTFLSARIEIAYHFKKFQLGGSLIVPVTNVLSAPINNPRPLNGHVFLRWSVK